MNRTKGTMAHLVSVSPYYTIFKPNVATHLSSWCQQFFLLWPSVSPPDPGWASLAS